jgi:hypothetical protein
LKNFRSKRFGIEIDGQAVVDGSKKAYPSSDVNLINGAILSDVDLLPWVFGIGLADRH